MDSLKFPRIRERNFDKTEHGSSSASIRTPLSNMSCRKRSPSRPFRPSASWLGSLLCIEHFNGFTCRNRSCAEVASPGGCDRTAPPFGETARATNWVAEQFVAALGLEDVTLDACGNALGWMRTGDDRPGKRMPKRFGRVHYSPRILDTVFPGRCDWRTGAGWKPPDDPRGER